MQVPVPVWRGASTEDIKVHVMWSEAPGMPCMVCLSDALPEGTHAPGYIGRAGRWRELRREPPASLKFACDGARQGGSYTAGCGLGRAGLSCGFVLLLVPSRLSSIVDVQVRAQHQVVEAPDDYEAEGGGRAHLGSRPIGGEPARLQARTSPVDEPSESKPSSRPYREDLQQGLQGKPQRARRRSNLRKSRSDFSSTVHTLYLAAGGRKGSGGKLSTRAVE